MGGSRLSLRWMPADGWQQNMCPAVVCMKDKNKSMAAPCLIRGELDQSVVGGLSPSPLSGRRQIVGLACG